ncbi:MAG TPA: hypothetical protein P5186_00335 [Candidatus Paceibacterota bacterium]|nr:hypothetical protein [Verrucomicrobiota bacterium]HRY46472.1 hypothetical protein [Candidatus Paceibacterota bacterium]
MKKPTAGTQTTQQQAASSKSGRSQQSKVHPVIIYPFQQPNDYLDLEELYRLVARLDAEKTKYARPITVMDRKTSGARDGDKRFLEFRKSTVGVCSDILDAWCVDTCQMWYSGLGMAYDRGGPEDVYWLIPGDFNYGSPAGREVLGRLHDLPEIIAELQQDICVGEVLTDHSNPKQLIDTYGTFALLYNWFPAEAREIRQYTERPRSEFFAVHHRFLHEALNQRWYAYEQTVVMLLHAAFTSRSIARFSVGNITDLPEGRESVASAMQQVERTERVLKTLWRERNQIKPGWIQEYRVLESQSEQVLRTALIILQNLLEK